MTYFPVRWTCPGRVTIAPGAYGVPKETRCPYFWEDWSGTGRQTKARKRLLNGQHSTFIGPDAPEVERCPAHPDLPLRKARKPPEQQRVEAEHRAFFVVGGQDGAKRRTAMYRDVAKRKSKCRACLETIMPGEERIAFDYRMGQAVTMPSGGLITGRREYVHFTCFVDRLMGGHAGEGCPGCTAKVGDREFREYKKSLKDKINAEG